MPPPKIILFFSKRLKMASRYLRIDIEILRYLIIVILMLFISWSCRMESLWFYKIESELSRIISKAFYRESYKLNPSV